MAKFQRGVPITLWVSSVDAQEPRRRTYKTLQGAQAFAYQYVGTPTLGSTYAISDDGVGKIECEGCTLEELFPTAEPRFAR